MEKLHHTSCFHTQVCSR